MASSAVSGTTSFLKHLFIGYNTDNNRDLHHAKSRLYFLEPTLFKQGSQKIQISKKMILTVKKFIYFFPKFLQNHWKDLEHDIEKDSRNIKNKASFSAH